MLKFISAKDLLDILDEHFEEDVEKELDNYEQNVCPCCGSPDYHKTDRDSIIVEISIRDSYRSTRVAHVYYQAWCGPFEFRRCLKHVQIKSVLNRYFKKQGIHLPKYSLHFVLKGKVVGVEMRAAK